MHGVRRVLIFCGLTALLPILLLGLPLYLRHHQFADRAYIVTESDILEVRDGLSTVFCSAHTLEMNGTFNAFQMDHRPEITTRRKYIQLKKSMILPDDTLEYWGFYLLKGATVALSVCSRFPGASILVVKGDRSFSTCGMLDHNGNKARAAGMYLPRANEQMKITFGSNAQIIDFEEATKAVTSPRNLLPDKREEKLNKLKKQRMNKAKKQHEIVERLEKEEEEEEEEKEKEKDEELVELEKIAQSYLAKHIEDTKEARRNVTRRSRHTRKHHRRIKNNKKNQERGNTRPTRDVRESKTEEDPTERTNKLNLLKEELNSVGPRWTEEGVEDVAEYKTREKRNDREGEAKAPLSFLDHGIQHGGNAQMNSSESSISSFEEGLLNCYGTQALLAQEFEPSELCSDVTHLINGKYMQTLHNVTEDGYYYYIFYSDNDIVFNDIHALFDIYKPTFQYENVTNSCLNKTECTFPLKMFSNDRVIVEIPTKDGIEHGQNDISLLVSICRPRTGVYTIFPIAVLFLILTCAFV